MLKQHSTNRSIEGTDTGEMDLTASTSEKKSYKKRKKQRHIKHEEEDDTEKIFPYDGVMKQLQLLDESDIVKSQRKPNVFTLSSSQGFVKNSSTSSKVYVEVKGGFRALEQKKMMDPPPLFTKQEGGGPMPNAALEAATKVQSWFRQVATLCHGLLAGLALCQALTIWLLAPPHHTWQDFVEHYTYIAYPFYASSHFLLIICVISVFDRYDICKFQWHAIRDQLSCGLELLTLLLYPLALGLALMGADRDIRLGQFHKTNSSVWWEEQQYIEKQLEEWKVLILIKCIAVIVSWLLLGVNPLWDKFHQRLKESKEA